MRWYFLVTVVAHVGDELGHARAAARPMTAPVVAAAATSRHGLRVLAAGAAAMISCVVALTLTATLLFRSAGEPRLPRRRSTGRCARRAARWLG